jgi:hypothetical protein
MKKEKISPLKKKWWQKVVQFISLKILSPINWNPLKALVNGGVYWNLQEEDHNKLRKMLRENHYFLFNYRDSHLTTYFIQIATIIKTHRLAKYTHAFVNVDGDIINTDEDFRIIEATGKGVHYSTFMEVFDCDAVMCRIPKKVTPEEWVLMIDKVLKEGLGKPYDTLFDVMNDQELSCVEVLWLMLKALPNYEQHIPNLLKEVEKVGNITPQMLVDTPDFKTILEIRRSCKLVNFIKKLFKN